MNEIEIHGKKFIPYIAFEEIEHAIKEMANKVYEEYKDETPIFIGVLNGVVMFMSDFLKQYPGDCEISFLKLKSYEGTEVYRKNPNSNGYSYECRRTSRSNFRRYCWYREHFSRITPYFTREKSKSLKVATYYSNQMLTKKT
jgi:Hypoxanthine-guanine phosphoribosyltransferase